MRLHFRPSAASPRSETALAPTLEADMVITENRPLSFFLLDSIGDLFVKQVRLFFSCILNCPSLIDTICLTRVLPFQNCSLIKVKNSSWPSVQSSIFPFQDNIKKETE